jgi:hypothetical protein
MMFPNKKRQLSRPPEQPVRGVLDMPSFLFLVFRFRFSIFSLRSPPALR